MEAREGPGQVQARPPAKIGLVTAVTNGGPPEARQAGVIILAVRNQATGANGHGVIPSALGALGVGAKVVVLGEAPGLPAATAHAHRPAARGADAALLAGQAAAVVMGRRRPLEAVTTGTLRPLRALTAAVRGRPTPALGRPGGAPDVGHTLVVQVAEEGRNGPIHRDRQVPRRHRRLGVPGPTMEGEAPAAEAREVTLAPNGLGVQGEGRLPTRNTAGLPPAVRAEGHRATGLQEAMVPGASVVLAAIGAVRQVGEVDGLLAGPGGAHPTPACATGEGRPMVPVPSSTAGAQVGPAPTGLAAPLGPHPGVATALARRG